MDRWRVGLPDGSSALLLGVAALFAGSALRGAGDAPFAWIVLLTGIYFVAALLLGLVWPRPAWRWGVLVTLPLIAFLSMSVAFAGQIGVFLERDLVPMAAAVAAAILGGKVGEIARRAWLPPGGDDGA